MAWIDRVKENLEELSNGSGYFECVSEWDYIETYVADINRQCDLCDHTPIRYINVIKNRLNDNEMEIGSECIKRFLRHNDEVEASRILEPEYGLTIEESIDRYTRLAAQEFCRQKVREVFEENSDNDFYQSLYNQFTEKGNLSPKQISYLNEVYGNIDSSSAKSIFCKTLKVNLRKNINKDQIRNLDIRDEDIEFVKLFMSTQQKKRFHLI